MGGRGELHVRVKAFFAAFPVEAGFAVAAETCGCVKQVGGVGPLDAGFGLRVNIERANQRVNQRRHGYLLLQGLPNHGVSVVYFRCSAKQFTLTFDSPLLQPILPSR